MTTNPFTFGNPINDAARFYGRKQEIRQIVNRLLSSAHESTSIVGERRIGKTSLLYYLSNPDAATHLGLTPNKYCIVYIDFQGLTDITPQRFWQRVLLKMARASCDQELATRCKQLAEQNTFDLFDFEDLFAAFGDHALNVVFLLDEFEYVTQNQKFGSDFFGGLRALAIHYPLALIPATQRELVDLCHSKEIKGSPFFNIFANVVLRPFTREDAAALIEGYVTKTDIALTPEEKGFILNLGGGHPFFLQMAGYYMIERKAQGLASSSLLERVTADLDQQANPHYTYLWAHCSESEKITLLTVMMLGQQKPSPKTEPNLENITKLHARSPLDTVSLVKRGLLEERNKSYSLFSPNFGRWITHEITAPAGQEETPANVKKWIDEWIKKEGRGLLSPAKGILPRIKKKYWSLVMEIVKEASIKIAFEGAYELIKVWIR
jgi:AAA+ ATPase superfamily predicted ATPase